MKKIAVVVVLVVVVVVYLRVKFTERDRIAEQVSDYLYAACGNDEGCSDRLVRWRPCLAEAYRFSPGPGGDAVSMDALVSCLNGQHPVATLDALRDAEAPFPTVR
jgi:hypothetical protein